MRFSIGMLIEGEIYDAECEFQFGQIYELVITDGYGNEVVDGMIRDMMEQYCIAYGMDEESTVRNYDPEGNLH